MSGNEIAHDHSGDGLYILGKNKQTKVQLCPYCGGLPRIAEIEDDGWHTRKYVTCTSCGLSSLAQNKMQNVISEWNRVVIDNI